VGGLGERPRLHAIVARVPTVTTTKQELDDSRVRVDVEVTPDAVERELQRAAGELGRDVKIPGFRKGKVPPQVVLQRMGREAVLDEAIRRALPDWYEEAINDARVSPVGEPKLDMTELPGRGSPLAFSIEVGVRPKAKLGDYKGLEVGRREPEVPADEVGAEVERLRESVASLENVERAAQKGDFVVVDFIGRVDGEAFDGGEARGTLLELGSGRFIPGFEDQLEGAEPGEERQVTVTFPEDYRAEELAGNEAVFDVTVKEVKEKRLPELDDDFASEAGGFDTLDELRSDVESRLREAIENQLEYDFREAVVDAAVDTASLEVPKELVHAKAHEMWASTARRMQRQGVDPQRYLEATGKDPHDIVHEIEPDAERSLKREAVLAAIVESEGIEVSDDEMLESLREATGAGAQDGPTEKELRKSLERAREQGRDESLREDIAMRKAVDLLVEQAKPIPLEQAEAREAIWTPEKERAEGPKELWTPGS
jgi:trigger factor